MPPLGPLNFANKLRQTWWGCDTDLGKDVHKFRSGLGRVRLPSRVLGIALSLRDLEKGRGRGKREGGSVRASLPWSAPNFKDPTHVLVQQRWQLLQGARGPCALEQISCRLVAMFWRVPHSETRALEHLGQPSSHEAKSLLGRGASVLPVPSQCRASLPAHLHALPIRLPPRVAVLWTLPFWPEGRQARAPRSGRMGEHSAGRGGAD